MAISNVTLTSTVSNVYVSSGNTVVSVMYFCNPDVSTRYLNVYAVPSGTSTIDDAVKIYNNVTIAPGDTFVVDMEKLVLGNGDSIRANASANLTATVSYVGI